MTDTKRRGPETIPPLSLVLGFGPMLPLAAAAVAAWLLDLESARTATVLGLGWGVAILFFLSGVRRGLSFFTEGGARPTQVLTTMWLFLLGLGAVAALVRGVEWSALVLALGYLSIGVLDPIAARVGEVPAFFAKLRPPQMALAVVSLVALAVRWWGVA